MQRHPLTTRSTRTRALDLMKPISAALLAVGPLMFSCASYKAGGVAEELIFPDPPYTDVAKALTRNAPPPLDRVDANYEGRETRTPWGKDTVTLLLWATLSEAPKSIEALLRAGADPNRETKRGMTPLMIAVASKDDSSFKVLLQHKADPNKIFRGGVEETALTIVLRERRNLADKRFERAAELIRSGANLDLDLDRGTTATIQFGVVEDWRAVYWLLEQGANYEARNQFNATVMCHLRNSYWANTLTMSEAHTYRDKVRDWLLSKSVARSRMDPSLHPNTKCDD